jgi:hypothetical protein
LGIQKSRFEFLCFIHDDIFIHTKNWGNVIEDIFVADHKIGLIGVAGSKIKSKMPSPWWNCPESQRIINVIQHYNHKDKENIISGFDGNSNIEVSVIDGVFMAARKKEMIKFAPDM